MYCLSYYSRQIDDTNFFSFDFGLRRALGFFILSVSGFWLDSQTDGDRRSFILAERQGMKNARHIHSPAHARGAGVVVCWRLARGLI